MIKILTAISGLREAAAMKARAKETLYQCIDEYPLTGYQKDKIFGWGGNYARRMKKRNVSSHKLIEAAEKLLAHKADQTADILQDFGVAKDRSLELCLSTQRLAADLVSFSNVEEGTERASAALTDDFTGERNGATQK